MPVAPFLASLKFRRGHIQSQPGAKRLRIQCAGLMSDHMTPLEQHQGRNASDVVASGQLRLHFSVDLEKADIRFEFGTNALVDGSHNFAGPHHCAQKSTSTGISLRWMWISKLVTETGTGRPVKRAWWHWPHLALRASFPLGIRFTLLQCGQTMCRTSSLMTGPRRD